MNSQVDVLIPVYNAEPYLKQCLDSIVSQDYDNIRVVIINDGSKDNSWNICQDYDSKYSFIEAYTQTNAGVAETRNRLLNRITGEYFLFVDADDWIEPNMISYLVDTIDRNNIDIAVCKTYKDSNKSQQYNGLKIWDKEVAIEKFLYHIEINGSLWNKLIKTSLVKDTRFDPEISYGEDALFIWQLIQRVERIGISNNPLYHYRININSISHQKFDSKKISGHKVWETIAKDSSKLGTDLAIIAKANFAVADFWLLYFAAMGNYPRDFHIIEYQHNLARQLSEIKRLRLLSATKLFVARLFTISYRATSLIIRLIK